MQKEFNKFNESDIMEGMSSISAVIKSIINKTSDRHIISVYVDSNKKRSKAKEIGFLVAKSKELNFDFCFTDEVIINEFATGTSHGGIIAFCTPRNIPQLTSERIKPDGVYYLLEGIEDPYNFGYALRSIYATGADGVILTPRNWMGVAGVVARSSAGTSELIDMSICDAESAIDLFSDAGYTTVCAGIRNSESIFETDLKKPLFVILGGEKRGISSAVLDKADKIVRIDYGNSFNGSLSTASATAVFAFEILRQNR